MSQIGLLSKTGRRGLRCRDLHLRLHVQPRFSPLRRTWIAVFSPRKQLCCADAPVNDRSSTVWGTFSLHTT